MKKSEKIQKITPEPYIQIGFGCSNRAFYEVKNDLYEIAEEVGVDPDDGYMTDECDYEGDLEKIIIYNCERAKSFVDAVCKAHGVDAQGMDIHMSCY